MSRPQNFSEEPVWQPRFPVEMICLIGCFTRVESVNLVACRVIWYLMLGAAQFCRVRPFVAAGNHPQSPLFAQGTPGRSSRRQACSATAMAQQVQYSTVQQGGVHLRHTQRSQHICRLKQAVTIIGGGRVGQALADMGPGNDVSCLLCCSWHSLTQCICSCSRNPLSML